jgi:hypothetical protein
MPGGWVEPLPVTVISATVLAQIGANNPNISYDRSSACPIKVGERGGPFHKGAFRRCIGRTKGRAESEAARPLRWPGPAGRL